MNDNLGKKPKTDWAITIFVFTLLMVIPGGIIAGFYFEDGTYFAIAGVAFLIFAAGGAL